jgi:hypothetical protein
MRAVNTLASMKGVRPTASLLAATACAAALIACGGDDENGPIPADQGESLIAQLDHVQEQIEQGDCVGARSTAAGVASAVEQLPEAVGGELRETLVEASSNLQALAADPDNCKPADTGASGETDTVPSEEAPTTTTTTTEETTTETTTEEPADDDGEGNGPPPDTPGQGTPGGGNSGGGDDFSGGIGSDG